MLFEPVLVRALALVGNVTGWGQPGPRRGGLHCLKSAIIALPLRRPEVINNLCEPPSRAGSVARRRGPQDARSYSRLDVGTLGSHRKYLVAPRRQETPALNERRSTNSELTADAASGISRADLRRQPHGWSDSRYSDSRAFGGHSLMSTILIILILLLLLGGGGGYYYGGPAVGGGIGGLGFLVLIIDR